MRNKARFFIYVSIIIICLLLLLGSYASAALKAEQQRRMNGSYMGQSMENIGE